MLPDLLPGKQHWMLEMMLMITIERQQQRRSMGNHPQDHPGAIFNRHKVHPSFVRIRFISSLETVCHLASQMRHPVTVDLLSDRKVRLSLAGIIAATHTHMLKAMPIIKIIININNEL